MKITYDDGMTIDHSPARGWIDETGDPDSRPAKNKVHLPAGSIAGLEELLGIAAARCAALDVRGLEVEFGPESRIKFTGRVVGAGTSCAWLEVRLRIERDKYGDQMAACHLRRYLEGMGSGAKDHPVAARVIAYLRCLECQEIVGARDEHTSDPEYRPTLASRVDATSLAWWLDDSAKQHGAVALADAY